MLLKKLSSRLHSKKTNLELWWARRKPKRYIRFLKKKGIKIGNNLWITPRVDTVSIDITRPSLVEIGDNVRLNRNFTLITHDGGFYVPLNLYHEFIPQSGKVTIGNNVYFGRNCSVFKGVTIGNNCIIGFGSIVTRDIPSNSVAVGAPAKVVGTIEDYYAKRKQKSINEALAYAKSIQVRFNRRPKLEEFWEEFPLFIDKENMHMYPNMPYKRQLGPHLKKWKDKHKKIFNGFDEFLKDAGVE